MEVKARWSMESHSGEGMGDWAKPDNRGGFGGQKKGGGCWKQGGTTLWRWLTDGNQGKGNPEPGVLLALHIIAIYRGAGTCSLAKPLERKWSGWRYPKRST